MALDQAPHFAWPAHRETLEDDPLVITGDSITTALQSDPSHTEAQLITNIFTSATDFLSEATENITSTNMNILNSTELSTEQSINVQEKTYSKIEDMLGSPLQSSIATEPLVEINPVNIITEMFSKTVSTEKPPYENGHYDSNSWEQPIISTSKYPLIDTSEFGINMNTESGSTIDTMKEVLMETVLKEKGLFEEETTEKPISSTINTLRDMFMRAVAKEEPLLDAAKTESSLDFRTSNKKPLFETFSVKEPFLDINSVSTEKTFIQNMTITEGSIEFSTNTNSTVDKMADIFSNSTKNALNDSNITTTNSSLEALKDVLSTTLATDEPSNELGRRTFEQMNDKLSTTIATEGPLTNLSLNEKTNSTVDLMADIFNRSVPTERPFLRTISTFDNIKHSLATQESVIEFGQSTFDKMNDILSTTEDASIEIGQIINTNSSTNMMADVFNMSTPIEQSFIQTTSTSERIKEMLLSSEEPSIKLSHSNLEQLKEMLSTTEAAEEPSIDFDLGTKTNSTTDMRAEVFNRSTLTESPFIQNTGTLDTMKDVLTTQQSVTEFGHSSLENMKDFFAEAQPPIDFRQSMNTNSTIDMRAEVFNRSTLTESPFIQNTGTLDTMKDVLTTQQSVTEFGHSSLENMKDFFTEAQPPIDFQQGMNTNSTIDMIADVFNTTPTEQPFFQTSTSEKVKEMLLSTKEPSIKLSHSTLDQLKYMLSTTEATEDPSIVSDLGTKTNGTTDMIADVFNRSTLIEPPFFRNTSTLEKMKDTLTTQHSITEFGHSSLENMKDIFTEAEPSIDFRQRINANSTIDMIADVFNRSTLIEPPFFRNTSTLEKMKDTLPSQQSITEFGQSPLENMKDIFTNAEPPTDFRESININSTIDMMGDVFNTTSTEQPFIQTSTSEKIKEMLFSTEEATIELSHSTFEQLKDMLSTTEAIEEPRIAFDLGTKANGTIDMIVEVFNRSTLTERPFFQSTSTIEKIKDMPNTKSSVDTIADIFNGTTSTQNLFFQNTTKDSPIEFGKSTFEQFEQNTNSNRIDMIENIFNDTTPTIQTFVQNIQNTSTFRNIKDMLSTTWATDEPSIEFTNTKYDKMRDLLSTTTTEKPSIDFVQSANNTIDMIKEVFNRSTSTEQSKSLNNVFVTLQDLVSVPPSEFSTDSNDSLSLVKNINTEQTLKEPINNATFTSTGAYSSDGFQAKFNSAIDIFTTEMSTKTPFTSSTSSPEDNSTYFNLNATSNSTEIFRTDPSIFQSSIDTHFLDPIENITLTEDAISSIINPIKKSFEDVLISSNFSSTTKEALGIEDGQNQIASEPSWTIYIILGVILAVLIILTVGGYIICRKYRRNRKSGGGYYVTHLKDYSDSSVKTVSDSDTVNIRL